MPKSDPVERICANPLCAREFVTSNLNRRYCSRPCSVQKTNKERPKRKTTNVRSYHTWWRHRRKRVEEVSAMDGEGIEEMVAAAYRELGFAKRVLSVAELEGMPTRKEIEDIYSEFFPFEGE